VLRTLHRLATLAVTAIATLMLIWPNLALGAQPPTPSSAPPDSATAFVTVWVLTLAPADLWSGSGTDASVLEAIPLSTPLKVLAPQVGGRLPVMNPRSDRTGWVDAPSVGPIPDPSPSELAAMLAPPPFEQWWGMTHRPATAWSSAAEDATSAGEIPQWRYLRIMQPAENGRVLTMDPRTEARAYVELTSLGPVGAPPEEYFAAPPADTQSLSLPARIVGAPDSYDHPERKEYFSLRRLAHNQSVTVQGVVDREEAGRWYRIGEAEYIPTNNVRTPPPPPSTFQGRWIDANLNEPVIVTAYEGDRPVYAALAVKGAAAFQTPTGVHRIQRRVASETMNSETIGIPRNSANGYFLENVLYTQYFTGDGAALHYNYWRSDWGYAGSKGCLGMNLDDSRFFWDFAGIGTIVNIHN
jgi:hypothetical protein